MCACFTCVSAHEHAQQDSLLFLRAFRFLVPFSSFSFLLRLVFSPLCFSVSLSFLSISSFLSQHRFSHFFSPLHLYFSVYPSSLLSLFVFASLTLPSCLSLSFPLFSSYSFPTCMGLLFRAIEPSACNTLTRVI